MANIQALRHMRTSIISKLEEIDAELGEDLDEESVERLESVQSRAEDRLARVESEIDKWEDERSSIPPRRSYNIPRY